MLVKPSVQELLGKVDNRYRLVTVVSKRARQLADGDLSMTKVDEKSPVNLAANEVSEGTVKPCKLFYRECLGLEKILS